MNDTPRLITRILGKLATKGKAAAALGILIDNRRLGGSSGQVAAGIAESGLRRHREAVYRRIWEEASAELGVAFEETAGGFIEMSSGGNRVRVWHNLVPLDDPVTLHLAGDKPTVHAVLADNGLPVAAHVTVPVGDLAPALEFVRGHDASVVKPAHGAGRGDGITGWVRTHDDLLRARMRAARYDPARMLIEQRIPGVEYRVLVVDGEPMGLVQRRPPTVVGDGASTVRDLMKMENERRMAAQGEAGLFPLTLDLDAALTLLAQGLRPRSVPDSGTEIVVKSGTSQGSDRDATAYPVDDPSMRGVVTEAVAAAEAVGVRFAGVELITPDTDNTLAEAGGVVVEINTTPGLAQHYHVDNRGSVAPVAVDVLRHLLKTTPPPF